MKKEIRCGKYKHFKGHEYEVIGIARHSENEEEMVVYRALYGDGGLWVRPASMWNETVERDGKVYQRFTYIGEKSAESAETNSLLQAEAKVRPDVQLSVALEAYEEAKVRPDVQLSVVLEAYEEATNAWTYYYDLEKHENIYIFTSSFMDDEEERELVASEPERFIRLPKKAEIYEDARVKAAMENGDDLEDLFMEMAAEFIKAAGANPVR